MSTFFQLLHLADSALPTGGYAFASGLESAAKLRLIQSQIELRSYLRALLDDWASFELPWLNGFLDESATPATISHLAADYHATFQAPSMTRASQIQGRGLLRFLERTHPGPALDSAIAPLRPPPPSKGTSPGNPHPWSPSVGPHPQGNPHPSPPSPSAASPTPPNARAWLHHLPVFARGLHALGHPAADLRRLLLFTSLRDQISAAVRLGLLGPTDGHTLQSSLYPDCDALAEAAAPLLPADAYRACPLIELAQATQDRLYSRLFQS